MVSRGELALAVVEWVALFIPALAIMLNTFSNVYEESLLETIGIADARKRQAMSVSVVAFVAAFSAAILSLLYLLVSMNLLAEIPAFGNILVLAIVSIFLAIAITTLILHDFYRASSIVSIYTGDLEEIAESNPEQAAAMLNMAGQQKQIDQQELELIANDIGIYDKLKQQQDESNISE